MQEIVGHFYIEYAIAYPPHPKPPYPALFWAAQTNTLSLLIPFIKLAVDVQATY